MKILLLGGTSFFGKQIAKILDLAGHSVTLFSRIDKLPEDLSRFPHIKGDRNDPAQLAKASNAHEWEVVIDNIAYDAKTIKAAIDLFQNVKQYIFTSTISVYRYAPLGTTQPFREDCIDYDYTPNDENMSDVHWKYARGKMEAEKQLIRQAQIPWTILRPSIVYGPWDPTERGFWYLKRLMTGGPILLANNGSNSFRLAYSLDVASSYLEAIRNPDAIGRIYNIAGNEIITLHDFIFDSAKILGLDAQVVTGSYEEIKSLGGPYATDRNWIPNIEASRRDLAFRSTPWIECAETTAAWFRDCWAGDEKKLLGTREEELKLAKVIRSRT